MVSSSVLAQTALVLQPTEIPPTLHPIFKPTDWDYKPEPFPEKNQILSLKEYKAQLRKALAVQFNDHIEIGLDRFKAGPLNTQKNAMLEYESHLQLSNKKDAIARGYGVELRIKLD